MRAFRIEKNTHLHNVLKACDKISKNKRGFDRYNHIYYDAKNKTIFATNGWVLLTYQTDEIIQFLGEDIGNGTLLVCGEIAIFEDKKEDLFNYRSPIETHKSVKKLYTDFTESKKPHYCQAIMELAMNGIAMSPNVIKEIEPLVYCFDYVSLQEGKGDAVMFVGHDEQIKFLAIPYISERWRSYSLDDKAENN